MSKLTENVIENRRRIDNIFNQSDTAISNENSETQEYINNKFILNSSTTVTQSDTKILNYENNTFTLESTTTVTQI